MRFFAPCPPGATEFLREELLSLHAGDLTLHSRGLGFTGDLQTAYTASLYLRTASRLLIELSSSEASDEDALYQITKTIPWERKFPSEASFACRVTGVPQNKDPRFAALRIKDAVVDRFRENNIPRPTVDRNKPDIRIEAHWNGHYATIFLNWSGAPLHERGYRLERSEATLRETSAALVLSMAAWPQIAQQGGAFVDPVCGSGTLLAEAAMMAINAAPGVLRKKWGFFPWNDHDEKLWIDTLNRARIQFGNGLERLPPIRGFDVDPQNLKKAKNNLRRLGMDHLIRLSTHDIRTGKPANWPLSHSGLLCANPPYGHRLHDNPKPIYAAIGNVFRTLEPGWKLALLAMNRESASSSYLKATQYYSTMNGGMDLVLGVYENYNNRTEKGKELPRSQQKIIREKYDPKAPALKKALQRKIQALGKWAEKSGVSSYRIWDSEMPEFNVAVDWYEGTWIHIQEFSAPAKISQEISQRRLNTLIMTLKELCNCKDENIFIKRHKRGIRPYNRRGTQSQRMIIRENQARFFVNFVDYLDTGIFLDHRPTRARIRRMIGEGSFLNLFCYTGTATVMAALGGAESTVSVDVSNTYLDWCQDNLKLNRVAGKQHRQIRSDSFEWLKKSSEKFDLIFIDPPTYSNGTGRSDWSVQDDHAPLIREAMKHLNKNGTLIFSENFRRFVLDSSLNIHYHVQELTQETLHPDFALLRKSHRCWEFHFP